MIELDTRIDCGPIRFDWIDERGNLIDDSLFETITVDNFSDLTQPRTDQSFVVRQ